MDKEFEYQSFFGSQVVFLTGATGGLGGCLLYKLVSILRVPKVYVLIRSSPAAAVRRWQTTMPGQVNEMLQTGAIHFITGDITKPQLGMADEELRLLERQVTVVINAAANISFKDPLHKTMRNNYASAMELARMATNFKKLGQYVQISSAYANSHLQDGPVQETLYPSVTSQSGPLQAPFTDVPSDPLFPWPYAQAKNLMECSLFNNFSHLPLILIRPTTIGSAISQPFAQYGPRNSCPLSTFYYQIMCSGQGDFVAHTNGVERGENIFDEIPVDLVANLVLQHVFRNSRGIFHAGSRSYIRTNIKEIIGDLYRFMPQDLRHLLPGGIVFTKDRTQQESTLPRFWKILTREWDFKNDGSVDLDPEGPLGMKISHEREEWRKRRVQGVADMFRRDAKTRKAERPLSRL